MDTLKYYSSEFFDKYGDPRVQFPLMRTPWPVVFMCLTYLAYVKAIGPAMMRDRKPYELKSFIRFYNLLMVIWNGLGVYFWIKHLNFGLDAWGCRPIDNKDTSDSAMRLITVGYVFLISRLVEFVDTVCFVLRKKSRQISGFHVFHHFSVPIAVWFFVKFAPGGNSAIFPIVNTVIHTIMYSYYFLATYESARPYLGWKKYLTQMQIVQFLIMIVHSSQPLFVSNCSFPKVFLYVNILFSCIFIYLFATFYIENYGKKTVRVARQLSRRFSQQVQNGYRRLSLMSNSTGIQNDQTLEKIYNEAIASSNTTSGNDHECQASSQSQDTLQLTRRRTSKQALQSNGIAQ